METLARPAGRAAALQVLDRRRLLELAALAVIAVVAIALWLAYPLLPTYDSAWALLWGHQILAGHVPEFAAYRAPTEHPLWDLVGIACALLGSAGERAMTLITVLSLLALVAGVYELGRRSFGAFASLVATVLFLSRFHFAFYAAVAFLDVPYLALLVWAAVLELAQPRRGAWVWVPLIAAGLLRPDAWLYAAAYAVWLAGPWPIDWRRLLRYAPLVALPALTWGLVDLIVTGDPTFSFTFSTDDAAALLRNKPVYDIPWSVITGLNTLVRLPAMLAGVGGLALAGWRAAARRHDGEEARRERRRTAMPLAILIGGAASFGLTSLVGFSVVNRYLAFGAVGLVLFAGLLVSELLLIVARRARRSPLLAASAAALLLAGAAWTALHLHPAGATGELSYRTDVERNLRNVLHSTTVADRCGPISAPDHKLVPLIALDLSLDPEHVLPRSDTAVHQTSGVAIVVGGGNRLLFHNAYGPFGNNSHDPHTINDPPRGFVAASGGDYDFHLYVRCPAR